MDSQTVDITHPLHGVRRGVKKEYECFWKNGAWYYKSQGWRIIPRLQWVDVTSECVINTYQAIIHNGNETQQYPYRRSMRGGHIIIEKEMLG